MSDQINAAARAIHNEVSPRHSTWAALTDLQMASYREAVYAALRAMRRAGVRCDDCDSVIDEPSDWEFCPHCGGKQTWTKRQAG
jgi:rRNA maturation endonuclease Nob1